MPFLNLPPSLDHGRLENCGFIGRQAGRIAGRPVKHRRHLVANRAMRAHLVIQGDEITPIIIYTINRTLPRRTISGSSLYSR
jgi:hypothetical protein